MKNLLMPVIFITLISSSFSLNAADESQGHGTVAETIDVGSYVYVRLEENPIWLAGSPVPIEVGETVSYSGGAPMKDFYSPKLDRTFADILFVMQLSVEGITGELAQGHPAPAMQPSMPAGHVQVDLVAAPVTGEIPALEGGMTVAGVLSGYPHEQGSGVSVRARVMKISLNIMGKNWITLQDGTGTAPENVLIATSTETPQVGETVEVSGVVVNDISLGYGYDYKVLLEEAGFSGTGTDL